VEMKTLKECNAVSRDRDCVSGNDLFAASLSCGSSGE
jgi:hypothetical protein